MTNSIPLHPSGPISRPPLRGIERGHYLIVATPVLTSLEDFEMKLRHAILCDPNGASRHTFEYVITTLYTSLARAEEIELWGTLDRVHEMTGRPKSTITEWAANLGDKVWCWKKSGVWAVDLVRFDAWYREHLPALEKRKRVSRRTPKRDRLHATTPESSNASAKRMEAA